VSNNTCEAAIHGNIFGCELQHSGGGPILEAVRVHGMFVVGVAGLKLLTALEPTNVSGSSNSMN
jgi:hypothetical protein